MIRERQPEKFDQWLMDCLNGAVKDLRTFADGLDQDYQAVRAAMSCEWSNGPVEGQVNRLKLLKRQMYGRAKFDLLRKRLLNST